MVHVVGVQARRIQRFVFHSPRLRHMVGASELVESLCTSRAEALLGALGVGSEALRVAAAGKAWLRFDDGGAARRFAERFPVVAELHAPGLAVDVAHGEGADERVAYEAARSTLEELAGCPRTACAELSPLVDRARHTGGPAVGTVRRPERRERVDPVVARQDAVRDDAQRRLRAALETPEGLEWPTDLDELAGDDQPLVVLHADGNDFGDVLSRLTRHARGAGPLEVQRALSAAIARASTAALRVAVTVLYRAAELAKTRTLPGRPLVLGGDDLTMIVRADLALAVSQTYLERFEVETEAALGAVLADHGLPRAEGRLSACAGLALVKSSYPFARAYDLAESLCGWAKARSRRAVGPDRRIPSSLAFHRVTTSIVGDYDELLASELRGPPRSGGRAGLELAGGPYAIGDAPVPGLRSARQLEALADCLAGLGRGPRRRLLGDLKRQPDEVDLAWRRMLEVAGEDQASAVRQARRELDGQDEFDVLERTSLFDAHVLDFLRSRRSR